MTRTKNKQEGSGCSGLSPVLGLCSSFSPPALRDGEAGDGVCVDCRTWRGFLTFWRTPERLGRRKVQSHTNEDIEWRSVKSRKLPDILTMEVSWGTRGDVSLPLPEATCHPARLRSLHFAFPRFCVLRVFFAFFSVLLTEMPRFLTNGSVIRPGSCGHACFWATLDVGCSGMLPPVVLRREPLSFKYYRSFARPRFPA